MPTVVCGSTGAPGTVAPCRGAGLLGVPGCLACRAAWRAGLLGVPAGGDPPTVLLAAPLAFQAPSRLTVGRAAWRAGGQRPARSPSAPRALLGASSRSPARPCHRPPAPQPGPSDTPTPVALGMLTYGLAHHPDTPPGPTPPTGTATRPLRHPHTSGARHADVRLAHHPEARVGTASTHRHGSRTPLPRCRLFLSGVTPFSWALHHFPGGVMLPNWCNAP